MPRRSVPLVRRLSEPRVRDSAAVHAEHRSVPWLFPFPMPPTNVACRRNLNADSHQLWRERYHIHLGLLALRLPSMSAVRKSRLTQRSLLLDRHRDDNRRARRRHRRPQPSRQGRDIYGDAAPPRSGVRCRRITLDDAHVHCRRGAAPGHVGHRAEAETARHRHRPSIIMTTSSHETVIQERAHQNGCAAFFCKPIEATA